MTPKKKPIKAETPLDKIEDIYNLFMYAHEPELMLGNLPYLDGVYSDETEEERMERGKRYIHALELFQERFAAFIRLWKEKLLLGKKEAVERSKRKTKVSEDQQLQEIEHSFDVQ